MFSLQIFGLLHSAFGVLSFRRFGLHSYHIKAIWKLEDLESKLSMLL